VTESPTPTLVVVSGPPWTGKTSLAHAIARAIPCPAVCRDEIKEGMVHAVGDGFQAASGDPLTQRTLPVFFDVLGTLLTAGVTTVAEAAFQDPLWRHGLEPLLGRARLRIVQCHADPAVGRERRRLAAAGGQTAHARIIGDEIEDWREAYASFDRLSLPAPSIDVDTSDGYVPGIEAIVEFVRRR
jgi:predicted kinase